MVYFIGCILTFLAILYFNRALDDTLKLGFYAIFVTTLLSWSGIFVFGVYYLVVSLPQTKETLKELQEAGENTFK